MDASRMSGRSGSKMRNTNTSSILKSRLPAASGLQKSEKKDQKDSMIGADEFLGKEDKKQPDNPDNSQSRFLRLGG